MTMALWLKAQLDDKNMADMELLCDNINPQANCTDSEWMKKGPSETNDVVKPRSLL